MAVRGDHAARAGRLPARRLHRGNSAARQGLPIAGAELRAEGIADRHGVRRHPARRSFHRLSGGGGAAHRRRRFWRHHRHGGELDTDRLRPRGSLGIADPRRRLHAVADRDLAADPGAGRRAWPLRLRADVSEGRALVNASALIIDVTLWGSVLILGFMAWQRGRVVLVSSVREGSMDFINIVPRIALGVIGSGYIAAVIPPEVITGWLGPDSGWFGVLTAVIAGAATPGGPVVGFSIGAVALKVGGGPPQVIAYVIAWALFAFQRLILWEIPFMPAKFIWFRCAVSVPCPFLAAAIAMLIGKP